MDHSSMSMSGSSMTMAMSTAAAAATATGTAAASAATSSAASMSMSMSGGCKISMLWNWYTIDACFISSTWRVRSNGAFAASCIGVVLLVTSLEFLRRLGKEYDGYIMRQFQSRLAARSNSDIQRLNGNGTDASSNLSPQYATFRPSVLQQAIRAVIHAMTFGVAYIIMLLAMYYNGYIIICIILGAGLGKFACDWTSTRIALGSGAEKPKAEMPEEATLCCG